MFLDADLALQKQSHFIKDAFQILAENYGGSNWQSRYFRGEDAWTWENLKPLFQLHLGANWGEHYRMSVLFPLRRDAYAWHQDTWALNTFSSPDELDINVPKEALLTYQNTNLQFKIGRFKPSSIFTPRDIAFSGNSWQDGFEFQLGRPKLSYQVNFSSLNPWLVGNPSKNEGEWALQNQSLTPNQHNRIYNEPYKTLVSHYLTSDWEWLYLGMRELAMVGGVAPTFRTVQPFMFLHNNYSDGLNNTLFNFEAAIKYQSNSFKSKLYGEYAMDDINAGSGEEGVDATPITSSLWGILVQQQSSIGIFSTRIEGIYTHSAYMNSPLPLLRMVDRHLSRTNSRQRRAPNYFDTYISDLPIGYFRGPDCKDIWLDFDWQHHESAIHTWVGWLNQGNTRLDSPWEEAKNSQGKYDQVEELRLGLDLSYEHKQFQYLFGFESRQQHRWQTGFNLGIQRSFNVFSTQFK